MKHGYIARNKHSRRGTANANVSFGCSPLAAAVPTHEEIVEAAKFEEIAGSHGTVVSCALREGGDS